MDHVFFEAFVDASDGNCSFHGNNLTLARLLGSFIFKYFICVGLTRQGFIENIFAHDWGMHLPDIFNDVLLTLTI